MSTPAIAGGTPVRSTPFPSWPRVTEAAVDAVTQAARDGVWGSVSGPRKLEFERRFAEYHDAEYGLAVTNGTISLQLALTALGVGSGDEVIVPAYTFLATATAVLGVNALPVFADLDDTICLDPDAFEAAITPRTKAVIPVHLAGHPADMDRINAIAARHGIGVVEDAAHAHGAVWNGRHVGAIGDIGSWSFQASKNMSGGEGGALTTDDPELAEMLWSLHNCGRQRDGVWYEHTLLGGNHRMTEFQAALLGTQLDTLDADLDRRERSAARLAAGLAEIPGLQPVRRDPRVGRHAFHLYQLWYDAAAFGGLSRADFLAALRAEGIPASDGYPVPLNQQPLFAKAAFDHRATGYDPSYPPTQYAAVELPATERACRELIWLTQNVLLADDTDIDDVLTAAARVQAGAADVRKARAGSNA